MNILDILNEAVKDENFYRIEIKELGSFYRSINQILAELGDSDKEEDWATYEVLNRLVAELEYKLPVPEYIDKSTKFAYKENVINKVKDSLNLIKECIENAGYTLEVKQVYPNKIVYEDDLQIAYK